MNWYKEAKIDQTAVKALEKSLMEKHPGLDLALWMSNAGYVELAVIEVPKDLQGFGIGHEVVEEVKQFAQSVGLPVVLRPSANTGKKQSLERFYKDLGFVHNKGKNIDYRYTSPISPTMYWKPEEKQAQMKFEEPPEWNFPEADHDYDPAWEYDIDYLPDQELVQIAEETMQEINTKMIQQIGIGVCKTAYINGSDKKLARYINGTAPNPVFVINLQAIKNTAEQCSKDYNCNLETEIVIGIRTTLFHELGHAIQDWMNLEPDEDEAEEFAREYQDFGEVWHFWEDQV